MADFNQYSAYTFVATTEKNNSEDAEKVTEMTKKLAEFKKSTEVKEWLQANWNIRDDVSNFPISSNIRLSARNYKLYYSVTVEFEDEVKLYNYNK